MSTAYGQITIYGSDTNISEEFPLLSSVTALTDVVSYTDDLWKLEPTPVVESEDISYFGGFKRSINDVRMQYTLEIKPIDFPNSTYTASNAQYDNLFSFMSVYAKKYHYMIVDYSAYPMKIVDTTLSTPASRTVAVVLNGLEIEKLAAGQSSCTFKMLKAYAE